MTNTLTGQSNVTVDVVKYMVSRFLPTNMAAATTILCNMVSRNALIVSKTKELVSVGYKTIVFSDRRAHCENLKKLMKNENIDAALYIGGMKPFELKHSETNALLLATFHLAREGLDIPSIDPLVLACPRSDVIQACGRILHGKTELSPVIIDIVDQCPIQRSQYNKRCIYYNDAGFTINL